MLPRLDPPLPQGPLVLFDGVCPLCTASTRFILRHERAPELRFAPVQSPLGRRVLAAAGLPLDSYETFLLVEDGRLRTKSDAAYGVARHLAAPWRWLGWLRLPRPAADWLYDRVARNRYRLFGRYEACSLPPPAARDRFLG